MNTSKDEQPLQCIAKHLHGIFAWRHYAPAKGNQIRTMKQWHQQVIGIAQLG